MGQDLAFWFGYRVFHSLDARRNKLLQCCYRLWNSCSRNKGEHPSSPSFKDSPGKKRLRHLRVSVMKGTLQREPLPFHGSAENTSRLQSARAISPKEHVSSQLPERKTQVQNRITCPPPLFFFFFLLLLTLSAVRSPDWVWQLHSTLLPNHAPQATLLKWALRFFSSFSSFTCIFS